MSKFSTGWIWGAVTTLLFMAFCGLMYFAYLSAEGKLPGQQETIRKTQEAIMLDEAAQERNRRLHEGVSIMPKRPPLRTVKYQEEQYDEGQYGEEQ